MIKKSIFMLLLFIILGLDQCYPELIPQPQNQVLHELGPFDKTDRVLILAPHPDDETIGCGGVIQQAKAQGAQVKIAYLTNGDHNEAAFIIYEKRLVFRRKAFIYMGEVRRQEAIKAMNILGVEKEDLYFLGYPDFGTFAILNQYWDPQKPFWCVLCRISEVPYKDSVSYKAPYVGQNILSDLRRIIVDYKPTKIFVSHPADVNVDHKSLYLYLQIVLRGLGKEGFDPEVYPYLVHCSGWPLPRHLHPDLDLEPPKKFMDGQIHWLRDDLTPGQVKKKIQAMKCYKSQTMSSAFYLFSFVRKNELFGDYPVIHFKRDVVSKIKEPFFSDFIEMFAESNEMETAKKVNIGEREKVSYAVSEGNFLIRVEKLGKNNRSFNLLLYLFGYNSKTPFAKMPKIEAHIKGEKLIMLDKRRRINSKSVSLKLKPKELTLKIPLKILGDPDFLLSAIKIYGGDLPFDSTGFRKIEIE
ncbi:MAG: PIG-L family deacetylase [Candidatus Omnitrophica bacterium]|nr:PIG-L family deacetylase [Candidatus Omnitrophota bacterium]